MEFDDLWDADPNELTAGGTLGNVFFDLFLNSLSTSGLPASVLEAAEIQDDKKVEEKKRERPEKEKQHESEPVKKQKPDQPRRDDYLFVFEVS